MLSQHLRDFSDENPSEGVDEKFQHYILFTCRPRSDFMFRFILKIYNKEFLMPYAIQREAKSTENNTESPRMNTNLWHNLNVFSIKTFPSSPVNFVIEWKQCCEHTNKNLMEKQCGYNFRDSWRGFTHLLIIAAIKFCVFSGRIIMMNMWMCWGREIEIAGQGMGI